MAFSSLSAPSGHEHDLAPTQFADADVRSGRIQVLDMLDIAYHRAGTLYQNRPLLCRILKDSFHEAFVACTSQGTEFNQVLSEQLEKEGWIIADYSEFHRVHEQWEPESMTAKEAALDPIPDVSGSFPLRSQVASNDLEMSFPPLAKSQDDGVAAAVTASSRKKSEKDCGGKRYDKLGDAPSMLLPFPNGNVTLAEICAFLPQSIKSWDIIDRFIWNGVTTVTLVTMINHFRNMPRGKIGNSTTYRMMKGQIGHRAQEDPAYKGWTVATHQDIPKPPTYDHEIVSVAHFRPPIVRRGQTTVPDVPFRDLANGVKVWPSGYDALDLTRCVRYCVQHPDQEWLYPAHFEQLLAGLPQDHPNAGAPRGPAAVHSMHTDAAILERHTSSTALQSAKQTYTRKRDVLGRLIRKEKNDLPANEPHKLSAKALGKRPVRQPSDDLPANKPHKPSAKAVGKRPIRQPVRPRHLREITLADLESESEPEVLSNIDSDSDSDAYREPKRQKKAKETDRGKSGRVLRSGVVDPALTRRRKMLSPPKTAVRQ